MKKQDIKFEGTVAGDIRHAAPHGTVPLVGVGRIWTPSHVTDGILYRCRPAVGAAVLVRARARGHTRIRPSALRMSSRRRRRLFTGRESRSHELALAAATPFRFQPLSHACCPSISSVPRTTAQTAWDYWDTVAPACLPLLTCWGVQCVGSTLPTSRASCLDDTYLIVIGLQPNICDTKLQTTLFRDSQV